MRTLLEVAIFKDEQWGLRNGSRFLVGLWRCGLLGVVWPWRDSSFFGDDVGLCQSQTQYLIRGVPVSIARSVLLCELTVQATKKTAPSHGFESLSWLIVAFLSFHQSCQLWQRFWGGNLANQCCFRVAKSPPTFTLAEHCDRGSNGSFVCCVCGFL